MGHVDNGKTTTTAAIAKYLKSQGAITKDIGIKDLDKHPEESARGVTITHTTVEYETANRIYSHTDLPGHQDYIKNMITGSAALDYAILLVDANDGIMPQTKEHVKLARNCNVKNIIVFLNKMDMVGKDEYELVSLVEEEVKELLISHEFDVENISFIRGSALTYMQDGDKEIGENAIKQLVEAMDALPAPEREFDKPFLMSVQEVFNIQGRGSVLSGIISRGSITKDVAVEIFAKKHDGCDIIKSSILEIERFRRSYDRAEAGDNVGILCRGINKGQVSAGSIVSASGILKPYKKFYAEVIVTNTEDGGRSKPFFPGYQPQFFIRTDNITGIIEFENKKLEYVMPGDNLTLIITLKRPYPLEEGLRFSFREGGITVGSGIVTKMME